MKFIQKGEYKKYPKEIETWRLGENIPEWLSDRCKVISVNKWGELILDKRNNSSGGYELVSSGTASDVLVSTKSEKDYVCFSKTSGVFPLSESQINLLYEKVPKKECPKKVSSMKSFLKKLTFQKT